MLKYFINRRCTIVKLLFMIAICAFFIVCKFGICTTYASENDNELQVDISPEKESYEKGEDIIFKINIKNISEYCAQNIKIDSVLQNEKIKNYSSELDNEINSVAPFDNTECKMTLKSSTANSYDSKDIALMLIIFIVSICYMIYLVKNNKNRIIVSIIITVFAANSLFATTADAEISKKTLQYSCDVKIDGEDVNVNFDVSYDLDEGKAYEISEKDKETLITLIEEIDDYNDDANKNTNLQFSKLENGIPANDESKAYFLARLFMVSGFDCYDKYKNNYTIDEMNVLLNNAIGQKIEGDFDTIGWTYNKESNNYCINGGNKCKYSTVNIISMMKVSDTDVIIKGNAKSIAEDKVLSDRNFIAYGKINKDNGFGGITVTKYVYDDGKPVDDNIISEAVKENKHTENDEYKKLLKDNSWLRGNTLYGKTDSASAQQVEFNILDLDNDGTNELVFYQGTCMADIEYLVYKYKDGQLLKANIPASHGEMIAYNSSEKTITVSHTNMGIWGFAVYKYENNEVSKILDCYNYENSPSAASGNLSSLYKVDNKDVTKEQYNDYLSKYAKVDNLENSKNIKFYTINNQAIERIFNANAE